MCKVVIVTSFRLPFPGAAWRRIEYFAKFLADKGFKVFVIGTFFLPVGLIRKGIKRIAPRFIVANVQPYAELTTNPIAILFNTFASLLLILTILAIKPRVVIVTVPHGYILPGAYLGAKVARARLIVDYRDAWEDLLISLVAKGFSKCLLKALKRLYIKIYQLSDIVIVVTKRLARYMSEWGIRRVHVIPNGADLESFRPRFHAREKVRQLLGLSNNDIVVAYLGYVTKYYPSELIAQSINTIVRYCQSRVAFIFIGNGKSRELTTYLDKSVKYVALRPKLSKELISYILSASDLGLVARIPIKVMRYSIPVKVYEYIACGLPVIAFCNRFDELYNFIKSHGVGIAVDLNSSKDIPVINRYIIETLRNKCLAMRTLIDRRRGAVELAQLILSISKT